MGECAGRPLSCIPILVLVCSTCALITRPRGQSATNGHRVALTNGSTRIAKGRTEKSDTASRDSCAQGLQVAAGRPSADNGEMIREYCRMIPDGRVPPIVAEHAAYPRERHRHHSTSVENGPLRARGAEQDGLPRRVEEGSLRASHRQASRRETQPVSRCRTRRTCCECPHSGTDLRGGGETREAQGRDGVPGAGNTAQLHAGGRARNVAGPARRAEHSINACTAVPLPRPCTPQPGPPPAP